MGSRGRGNEVLEKMKCKVLKISSDFPAVSAEHENDHEGYEGMSNRRLKNNEMKIDKAEKYRIISNIEDPHSM